MNKPALLAVDDDAPVLAAIERDLRAHYGERYQVYTASSGEQALDVLRRLRLREDPVALLLVDQRMPGMSGVEFLAAARKLYPEARRVLLTAFADTDAAIKAINDAEVQYYLLKPWDPPEDRLYPVLDDLLQTWRSPPPAANLRLVGDRWSRSSHEMRDFLARNLVPYRWLDVESDPRAQELLEVAGIDAGALPALVLDDGEVLVQPEPHEIAARIGLQARAARAAYDLVVVGGGPAGLAAAVYGASEGLSTLVLECNAPGGQAGTTSRIENYLGFPVGLSGADLTLRAREQAVRLGAEILVPAEAMSARRADPYTVVRLDNGGEVSASTLVVATGAHYRTLDVPGVSRLTGAGVYYGAGRAEAVDHQGGQVFVVGGGNSAGQAAHFMAQSAEAVTLVVRGGDLAASMSRYLIDRLAAAKNIAIEYRSEVVGAHGTRRLEGLRLRSGGEEREVVADALFVFIGQSPRSAWLEGLVRCDAGGFVLTGMDVGSWVPEWPLSAPPLPLETSVPGVFAAGDVRHGAGNRIAAAVGEGAMAVRFAHQRLGAR